jgi:cell shape-determining protein MreD
MKLLLTLVACYAAFLLHVALVSAFGGDAAPNLTLVAGLLAVRRAGGVLWPAAAGLLCDCLFERPLGTTMLVATLVVTVASHVFRHSSPSAARRVAGIFLTIAVIESVARTLSSAATSHVDPLTTIVASLTVAAASAAAVALMVFAAGCLSTLVGGRRTA